MACSICGKNTAFPKKIYDGRICRDCASKLPTPQIEMTVDMARELLDFHGDTRGFKSTENLGKLYIDYGHGYFVVGEKVDKEGRTNTPYVFSVLDLISYSITLDIRMKKNGQPFMGTKKNTIVGDITFRCELNNPNIVMTVPLLRGITVKYHYTDKSHISWDEPMDLKKFQIAFKQMVQQKFMEYEDKLKRQREMERERMQAANSSGASELEIAMAVFFLQKGYTKAELRRQRNMLIKTFHPDNGETEAIEYAQKINHYYEILLKNIQ